MKILDWILSFIIFTVNTIILIVISIGILFIFAILYVAAGILQVFGRY